MTLWQSRGSVNLIPKPSPTTGLTTRFGHIPSPI